MSAASVTMTAPSQSTSPSTVTIESPSTSGCSSVVSAGELSSRRSDSNAVIPSHWCQKTQVCIDEKKMNFKARCYIVCSLATLLNSKHGPHPTKSEVEHISRQLILKFPFIRDDIGTEYGTTNIWVCVCYVCVCGVCGVCTGGECIRVCACVCVCACVFSAELS